MLLLRLALAPFVCSIPTVHFFPFAHKVTLSRVRSRRTPPTADIARSLVERNHAATNIPLPPPAYQAYRQFSYPAKPRGGAAMMIDERHVAHEEY